MYDAKKVGSNGPDISLFIPSLKEELEAEIAPQGHFADAPSAWQPRSTILFSVATGISLWTAIVLLACSLLAR